ncbi:MAG: response regulator transcription factor [Oscillospiraceae bacterium]|nr:response regulator transcription factor [Oscillospiraceae bacterium]
MPHLLVVDDEKNICTLVKKYAEFEGFTVTCAYDGMEAYQLCKENTFDLVIMDIMMPELDGFSAVAAIRKFSTVPVIMLSARGEEYDKIHGFELGIDDYVVKPFSPKELMMRVSAVLKRSNVSATNTSNDVYNYKSLSVDFDARTVSVDGVRLELSPKEYDLLFYLIRNRGKALSRDILLSEVWGYDYFGVDRTLDTHIKLLRRQLGNYANCIVTVRGVGYRFEEA